jgi:hypothetical protein
MVTARKRLPSNSPKKAQADKMLFTSKWMDSKSSPTHSYAQAVSENPYEVLFDPDDNDEDMDDANADTYDSSEATPKIDNAQVSQPSDTDIAAVYQPPQSRKNQRKIAKAAKSSSKHQKEIQGKFLSSATLATLARSKKDKNCFKGLRQI